jgi:hypothetical protein
MSMPHYHVKWMLMWSGDVTRAHLKSIDDYLRARRPNPDVAPG